MKKTAILILNILCGIIFNLNAQDNLLPQSPQTAAFARYGEYPVSHATGVPQIEIPLYEIKTRDINIPINISYHASGIKVEDVAPPVGLGWSLNVGGVIVRSIYGVEDKQGYTNNKVKSVQHAGELMQNKNVDINTTWRRWGYSADTDTQSDRYVYNFNGKSGVFRYNSLTNEIITIPYAPFIIEPTTTGFKIKDTDGLIYHFECMESRRSGDLLHTAAWYVTKIESQLTGSTVNLKYKRGTGYTEYVGSQIRRKGTTYDVSNYGDGSIIWPIRNNPFIIESEEFINFITYMPQLIDEITWDNNLIKFNYVTDRQDKYKDRLISLNLNVNNKNIRSVIFDNNSYWGNHEKNYRMRLNSVEIKGENNYSSGEKYKFKYNTTNLPDYARRSIIGDNIYCSEDYWGYYNGTSSLFRFTPNEYALFGGGTDRNPNVNYMQACILKEIEYPTGGSTTFEYETNKVSAAYDYNTREAFVGGLRIKNIVSKTEVEETRKTYEYAGYATQMIQSDMFQYKQDRIYSFLNRMVPQIFIPEWEVTTSSPLYSITGWSSSPVFYNTVTEYWGTSQTNTGKKVYKYIENIQDKNMLPDYPTDIYNHNLYRFWSPYYNYDQGLLTPLLASEETYELSGNNYILKNEIRNEYSPIDLGPVICGVRLSFRDDWIHEGDNPFTTYPFNLNFPYESIDDFFTKNLMSYDLIAYRSFKLLTKTQMIEYTPNGNINMTKQYTYTPDFYFPMEEKTTNSDGKVHVVRNSYPFNFMTNNIYAGMVSNNILSPLIEKTFFVDNLSLRRELTTYNYWHSKFYAPSLFQEFQDGGSLTRYEYSYNSNAYLQQVLKNSMDVDKSVYLWDHSTHNLIAEIKNATYEEVKRALGSVLPENLSSSTISNVDMVLRTNLSNSLVTTYTYKPLVGLETITDPRGLKTTYEYDELGRLKSVKDHYGNIIETYQYHYKNQ